MRARDVKCPKCGAGFADVAPDFDMTGQDQLFGAPVACITHGRCQNGHALDVRADGETVSVLATSIKPAWTTRPA